MAQVALEKQTLCASQVMTLKKVENCISKNNEKYYRLVFDMCLNDGTDNPRDVNCVDVPLFISKELLQEQFKGMKPHELEGLDYSVKVEFVPFFNFREGHKYVNWREEIIEIHEM